ncbi:MAG TPA: arsenite methyltransferase [Nitrosopumilus sp.]|jgi:arsenite methyltransferase|nr:MAG: protein-L-isoaspartate(D-aspartate) O-methyltransferase [Nitrosopumilus sp. BACL13 MAG-121220-bin23]KRO32292.1 MAG: protein-L-isoaspartate(D-aspartate) O-methyltransferase [Nitrosopumilus sp. BACL13 MAG-120910-bin56]HIH98923.1 arsenite methyltransferase [Nitrosopumilus sp.]HII04448.1 arsenite methyltransferase [Nitrosopumilus sp.]
MTNSIKDDIKKKYSKIVVSGNTDCCCMPGECDSGDSPIDATKLIGYDQKELESIPQDAILGVGCGAPINHTNLKEGETVVDLGSGAGIDIFLAARKVLNSGKAIGIDMTDEMLQKARDNAKKGNYTNVEFKKGDIEENIPLDNNSVDAVISNCVINLTTNKTNAFKEVFRILKNGGRMVISDLITDQELSADQVNSEKWCECIDGALTKENYLSCIADAGFKKIDVLEERAYMDGEKINGRKITSLIIKAIK